MYPSNRSLLWALSVALLPLSACHSDRPAAPALGPVSEHFATSVATSVAGIELPFAVMDAKLARVTHDVALALRDSSLRRLIFEELHASPYREHKVHFGGFLRQRGVALLERVAAIQGRSADAVLGSLDSVVDLELYMPVPQHFTTWRGDDRLTVVSQLRDRLPPVGFRITGEAISGLSVDVPPALPALVLVPVETDFSAPFGVQAAMYCDCGEGGGGGGGGDPTSPQLNTELWAVRIQLSDDGESWPRGSPELVIATYQVFTDGSKNLLRCAHEEQAAPYRFDADEYWEGAVLVAPLSDFDPAYQTSPLTGVFMWEDDQGSKCNFAATYRWEPVDAQMQRADALGYRADWRRSEQDYDGDGALDAVLTFLANLTSIIVLGELFNEDDLVGLVVLSGESSGFEDPKNIVRFLESGLPSGNGSVTFELR